MRIATRLREIARIILASSRCTTRRKNHGRMMVHSDMQSVSELTLEIDKPQHAWFGRHYAMEVVSGSDRTDGLNVASGDVTNSVQSTSHHSRHGCRCQGWSYKARHDGCD